MMIHTNLRPELAQHLAQRFQAFADGFRHNLAILGPPGSGKTFQLQQVALRHPQRLLTIYCPLYQESCRSFLQRLLYAILQAGLPAGRMQAGLPAAARAGERTDQQFQPPLDQLLQRAEAALPKTVAAIRLSEGVLARRQYGEAFTRALDAIPVLVQEREQPCALMLDEFLYLEDLGLGQAFHELGKRVMTWPSVLFVLSSSSTYRARVILRERLQLLFGQFELLALSGLDQGTAGAWVQQELRGIRRAKHVSPFLLHWIGHYPWYLTVILRRMKELATLGNSPELTEGLFLQTVWDVLGRAEGPLHQWCASRMTSLSHGRAGARALETLLHIAEGARTATELGRRIGRGGLTDALQLLVSRDLAERSGMCWKVTDPILRCWLSTILLAQRSDAPPGGEEVRQRFDRHLRQLWSGWMHAHELTLPEQVVSLFGKFCDDTIALDLKTGRLPRFETIRTAQPELAGADAYVVADGEGKRWCAAVRDQALGESDIAHFDAFCRTQAPRPTRKVLITRGRLDQNARLLAKTSNMWVWEVAELNTLLELYGP